MHQGKISIPYTEIIKGSGNKENAGFIRFALSLLPF